MKAEGGNLKPEMHKPQLSSFSFQPSTFSFLLSTFIPQLSAFYFLLSIFYFYSPLYATSAKSRSVPLPLHHIRKALLHPAEIKGTADQHEYGRDCGNQNHQARSGIGAQQSPTEALNHTHQWI